MTATADRSDQTPPVWQPDPLPGRPAGVPLPGAIPCRFTLAPPPPPLPVVAPPPVGAWTPSATPAGLPDPAWPPPYAPTAAWAPPPPPRVPPYPPAFVAATAPPVSSPSRRRRHWLVPVVGVVLLAVGVTFGVLAATSSTPSPPETLTGGPAETALVVATTNLRTGASVVDPVDMATGAIAAPIRVPRGAEAIATAPDGKTAYVLAAGNGSNGPGSITAIDLSSDTAGPAVPIPGVPVALGHHPRRRHRVCRDRR